MSTFTAICSALTNARHALLSVTSGLHSPSPEALTGAVQPGFDGGGGGGAGAGHLGEGETLLGHDEDGAVARVEALQEGEEGCLSVPGIYDKVERAERVEVRYLGLDGQPQKIAAEGLLAVCLQHEMDHLQGKVFVEHLSRLKQMRIRSRLIKQAKITA